jgi:serine/threonine-protein kinase HipA
MSRLHVLADGVSVGTLEVVAGQWCFQYAPSWRSYALAPNLPIIEAPFVDTATEKSVEWFFENLLPEGRLRELIATRDRLPVRDTWALLGRHGRDTAGALSLVPEVAADQDFQQTIDDKEILLPLSRESLQQKIIESRHRNLPLMAAWGDVRMSLAGAQEKLGLRIDEQGEFFLPEGTAASTHIVKPENASTDFPFCPANEFFCMRLAARLGLPVPDVDLLHLPEPLYVIRRFDRAVALGKEFPSAKVTRLHQIDLCQALGVAPSRKYESEGGLGLHDLFSVLQSPFVARPVVGLNAAVLWVVFNYLVGNLDAHAKNIAFLMQGQKAAVAPFYDLLCVEAYLPRQTLAMAIAGENKPGCVEGQHWDAMAYEADIAPRLVRRVLAKMTAVLPDAIALVMGDERFSATEHRFLRERVVPVIEERRTFAAATLSSHPLTLPEILARTDIDDAVLQRLMA